ncbi:hypothetical protein BDV12DRAFT_198704 [Aspergillus spectabilis]
MASPAGPKPLPDYVRFAAMIASLAAVITFGYSQGLHDTDVVIVSDLGNPIIAPVTGTIEYALIWSLIIGSIELAHAVPIHPGIYVAGTGYDCGRDIPNYDEKQVANVEHFGAAKGFLAVAIHFVYFVWACIATDKLRKSQRVTKPAA